MAARRKDSIAAEAAFWARLKELGGTALPDSVYINKDTPMHVQCLKGHDCWPSPGSVRSGNGICITCVGRDPVAAEAKFRARIVEFGAEFVGPYINSQTPCYVRCAEGHDCYPRPADLTNPKRRGVCKICAGQDPATAWANFKARVVELGGQVLEPEWLGAIRPHHVQCGKGHDCYPAPASIQQGHGICRQCSFENYPLDLAV